MKPSKKGPSCNICSTDFSVASGGVHFSHKQIFLILSHSNADPECLFSMVRKIETEEQRQLYQGIVMKLNA